MIICDNIHSFDFKLFLIGSEAMLAGIKVGDIIVEVNGRDCRSLEALELSQLMELKSLIQHVSSSPYPQG